jgi:hypothetical protein
MHSVRIVILIIMILSSGSISSLVIIFIGRQKCHYDEEIVLQPGFETWPSCWGSWHRSTAPVITVIA